jgi:hypothetical protein
MLTQLQKLAAIIKNASVGAALKEVQGYMHSSFTATVGNAR